MIRIIILSIIIMMFSNCLLFGQDIPSLEMQIEYEKEKLTQLNRAIADIRQQTDALAGEAALFEMAEILFEAELYTEASSVYQKFLEKFPMSWQTPLAYFRLVRCTYHLHQFDRLRHYYDMLCHQYPDSKWISMASYINALSYYEEHHWQQVIIITQRIDPLHQVYPYVQYLRGHSYLQQNQLKETQRSFRNIENRKDFALIENVFFGLGETYRRQGKYELALDKYHQISKKSDIYIDTQFAIGWTYADWGQSKRAITIFQKIAQTYPLTAIAANAMIAIGHVALNQRDYLTAENAYHIAILEFINSNPFYLPSEQKLVQKLNTEKKWVTRQKVRLVDAIHQPEQSLAALQAIYAQIDVLDALIADITSIESELTGKRIEAQRQQLLDQIAEEQNEIVRLQQTLAQLQTNNHTPNLVTIDSELKALTAELATLEYDYTDFQHEKAQQMEDADYGLICTAYAMAADRLIPYEMATARHEAFLRDYPQSNYHLSTRLHLAELHYAAEHEKFVQGIISQPNHRRAINHYQTLTTADSNYAMIAYYGLGYCYHEMGVYEQAISAFDTLTTRFPQSMYAPDSYLHMGDAFAALNDYESAIAVYRQLLTYTETPHCGRGLFNLGKAYYQLQAYESAIAAFTQLTNDNFYRTQISGQEYHQMLTWVVNSLLIYEETPAAIQQIFVQAGSQTYTYTVLKRLAEVYQILEQDEDAITVYRHLLDVVPLHPDAPQITTKLIELYEEKGLMEQALTEKLNLFKIYHKNSSWYQHQTAVVQNAADLLTEQALYSVATTYHQQNIYQSAEEIYSLFLKNFPKSINVPSVYFYRGECRWELEKFAAAALDYQKAAVDKQYQIEAMYNVVACYDTLYRQTTSMTFADSLQGACQKFVDLALNDPRRPEVLLKQGELYLQQQDYASAALVYQYVSQNYQDDPDVYPQALELTVHTYVEADDLKAANIWRQKILNDTGLDDELHQKMRHQLQTMVYQNVKNLEAQGDFLAAAVELENLAAAHAGEDDIDIVWWDAAQLYNRVDDWTKAAYCYQQLIQNYPQSKLTEIAILALGTCYEKLEQWIPAQQTFIDFYQQYPHHENAIEAKYRAALAYAQYAKNDTIIKTTLRQAIQAKSNHKKDSYWLAKCQFLLAEMELKQFEAVQLVEPLVINWEKKQTLMDQLLTDYAQIAQYDVAETTLPALFRIGQIYEQFLWDLWTSERPVDLTPPDLAAYNFQLEEQLLQYEEKAIKAYQAVLQRGQENRIENEWTHQSKIRKEQLTNGNYLTTTKIISDLSWKVSSQEQKNWTIIHFDDTDWTSTTAVKSPGITSVIQFTSTWNDTRRWIWHATPAPQIYLRKTFVLDAIPLPRDFYVWSITPPQVWINNHPIQMKRTPQPMQYGGEITPHLQGGLNAIALKVTIPSPDQQGIMIESKNQLLQSSMFE